MLDKRNRLCYPVSLVTMEQLGWAGQREARSMGAERWKQETNHQSRNVTSNQQHPSWRWSLHPKGREDIRASEGRGFSPAVPTP